MMPIIETPRGKIFLTPEGNARIQWNPLFASTWQGRYNEAQRFVDSEVLRQSEPYIPLRTGTLIASGISGTVIGSGLVQWIAPYAREQYYSRRQPGSETGPLRGPQWFERMKAVFGAKILAGAKKLAGGGKA